MPNGTARRYFEEVVLAYDGDECLTWPYQRDSHGYGRFDSEQGETRLVSRQVCEAVHGPAPSPDHEAAHSCGRGDKACVTKRHLSWKTKTENEADKLVHGTAPRGERHGMAKLTNEQVFEIKRSSSVPLPILAERYGVSRTLICAIRKGRKWGWLTEGAAR